MPLVKEQQHSWQWIAFWSQPRTEFDALHWCIAATKMSLVKTRQQCIAAKKWIWSIGHHPIQHISPPLFFIQQTSSINFISARLIFQLSRIFKKQHIFLIEIRIPMTGICEAWLLVFSALLEIQCSKHFWWYLVDFLSGAIIAIHSTLNWRFSAEDQFLLSAANQFGNQRACKVFSPSNAWQAYTAAFKIEKLRRNWEPFWSTYQRNHQQQEIDQNLLQCISPAERELRSLCVGEWKIDRLDNWQAASGRGWLLRGNHLDPDFWGFKQFSEGERWIILITGNAVP